MKKFIVYSLLVLGLLCWVSPVYAANQSSLLLTMPPILAAINDSNNIFSYDGNWKGTFSGTENGMWGVTIDSNGSIYGTGCSNDLSGAFTLKGKVNNNIFSAEAFATGGVTTGSMFSGLIIGPGTITGTWINNHYQDEKGTFEGALNTNPAEEICTYGDAQTVMWQGREWQRFDDGTEHHENEAETYCQELVLDGHSDWRLPTKDELKSLVVCTNGTYTPLEDPPSNPNNCGDGNLLPYGIPTIDSLFSCESSNYFALDTYASWPSCYYSGPLGAINFSNGSIGCLDYKYSDYAYVRCIRD